MKNYLVLFLLSISTIFAQKGSIKGIVTDLDNSDPLIGANIVIDGTTMGAATDIQGAYLISSVPAGEHLLKITYIGYEIKEQSVTVNADEELIVDVILASKTIQMQTYVVTASRKRERVEDAPAAISVISKKEIRRESNTNLGDYLKGTKGIDFTQSGIDSYNMTARGFNSSFNSCFDPTQDSGIIPSLFDSRTKT